MIGAFSAAFKALSAESGAPLGAERTMTARSDSNDRTESRKLNLPSQITQFAGKQLQRRVVNVQFGESGVVSILDRSAEMERSNFGQLLVGKILPLALPQLRKRRTGNGYQHPLSIDEK